MAVDMFLKIDDIKGESTDATHKDEIEVLSWSWGMSQSGSTHSGTGSGSGKVNVQDISITKYVDKSTPEPDEAVLPGHALQDGDPDRPQGRRQEAGRVPQDQDDATADLARSAPAAAAARIELTESITLNFGAFKLEYTPQKAKARPRRRSRRPWTSRRTQRAEPGTRRTVGPRSSRIRGSARLPTACFVLRPQPSQGKKVFMTAAESLRAGDLEGALRQLQDDVRREPGKADHRTFLFQLLGVMGQWERAVKQLQVVAELDPEAMAMAQTYREAMRCEMLRGQVFAGSARRCCSASRPAGWRCWSRRCASRPKAKRAHAQALRAEAFERGRADRGQARRRAVRLDRRRRLAPRADARGDRQRPLLLDPVRLDRAASGSKRPSGPARPGLDAGLAHARQRRRAGRAGARRATRARRSADDGLDPHGAQDRMGADRGRRRTAVWASACSRPTRASYR